MVDTDSISFSIECASIDLLEQELVITFSGPKKTTEVRHAIDDVFGDTADDSFESSVPVDSIDCSEARSFLADKHEVDTEDVLITRVDAPNKVRYELDT